MSKSYSQLLAEARRSKPDEPNTSWLFDSTKTTKQNEDQFDERKPHRNVALIVEQRRFWIPRDSLADQSPVFAEMLFEEPKKEEIELPDKKAEDILEMLRCLFPKDGSIKEVNYENVAVLVKLAHDYKIASLDHRCAHFIDSMIEGHKVIKQLFVDGVQFGLKKVVRACLPLLARFDLDDLKPMLDNMTDQVRSAVLYQIIGQSNGHQEVSSCYKCRNRTDNSYDDKTMKRCYKCFKCRKSTIWERDRDDAMIKPNQQCCRCLAPNAVSELEKIGF